MSHISDQITNYEVTNQVLYNRVIVQMGLAAFRLGFIVEAHQALNELCSLQRTKEILSQGVSKMITLEKEERRNLLPYHLHINVEVIEAVYYMCAMMLEIPVIAQDLKEGPKKVISKLFRKLFDAYDKSVILLISYKK
jgi:translation initiation factor 3 subunit C